MDCFRVPLCLFFKASLSAKQESHSLLCETILIMQNDFDLRENKTALGTHFHVKVLY